MKSRIACHLVRSHKASMMERLEDRTLLSAAPHGLIRTITFAQAPLAVQTGLDTLATTDNLSAPADTQTVFLGNAKGVETYTVDLSSTGTNSVLTVDPKGNPVTAPTRSAVTFADLTTANSTVSDEFNVIAAALNLTAPDTSATVSVLTNSDKTATYTLVLTPTTSTGRHVRPYVISVDSNGNPTGNERVPLSTLSTAIQTGLTSNAPVGSTALDPTYMVSVLTKNGVTTYSANYQVTGIRTTITVDNTGALANLPTTSKTQFSTIPTATQTQLQTLASNNGYTGTIADTQSVNVYDEANGTVIYSVRLPVTGTGKSGATYTYMIAVAADQNGNPTVPPTDNGFGGWGDFGGWGGFGGGWGWGGFGGWGHHGQGFGGLAGGAGDGGNNGNSGSSGGTTSSAGPNFTGFSHFAFGHGFRF